MGKTTVIATDVGPPRPVAALTAGRTTVEDVTCRSGFDDAAPQQEECRRCRQEAAGGTRRLSRYARRESQDSTCRVLQGPLASGLSLVYSEHQTCTTPQTTFRSIGIKGFIGINKFPSQHHYLDLHDSAAIPREAAFRWLWPVELIRSTDVLALRLESTGEQPALAEQRTANVKYPRKEWWDSSSNTPARDLCGGPALLHMPGLLFYEAPQSSMAMLEQVGVW